MRVIESLTFRRAVKRLHANQKRDLDDAVRAVAENPEIGVGKTGDLTGVRVFKFRMVNQLVLLAYTHLEDEIYLVDVGSHENFYRDLKKH